MRRIGIAAVLALTTLGACSKDSQPEAPPVSSAGAFRPCGAIGTGALAASALSPDGSVLVTATLAGQLILYRHSDGTRLNTLWDLPGQQVGVSFTRNGDLLVAASQTETRVWRFPDLAPVRTFTRPHTDRTTAVAISPDGAWVATGGFDTNSDAATVRIWSMADGSQAGVWMERYEPIIHSLAFSPDGASLAIAANRDAWVVRVPDAAQPRTLFALARGQISWSADGRLVAAGGSVVKVDTGEAVKSLPSSERLDVSTFSPDGSLYVEAAEAGALKVYRTSDWTTPPQVIPPQGRGRPSRVAFNADNTELIVDLGVSHFECNGTGQACGTWGNDVVTHSLQTPGASRILAMGPQMSGPLTLSPDGSHLAATTREVVNLWKTSDLSAVTAPSFPGVPWRLQLSPDMDRMLVNEFILDMATGQELPLPQAHALSPDFTVFVQFDLEENQLLLHDVATGKRLKEIDVTGRVVRGFSPDGRRLAVVNNRNIDGFQLEVVDVARGKVSHTFPLEPTAGVYGIQFSPDGRWLSSAGQSSSPIVQVLGLRGQPRVWLPAGTTAAFSPDSTVLATGNTDAEVQLWRTSDFTVREKLLGHGRAAGQEPFPRAIESVAFARTGQLVTLGADRTLRIWCSQ
ncbi:WD40 repeat domain-containing protein [Myxococcus landrumensis]|uniref:WD40 repeat domain-containing protein n=1 Tax=Myxococcus landrumensis TaxID=2813577 RepID=A0ABX7N5K0_9BACT|nr:WD40 repeat domain-containing protein [Myxococcus landrumus]QSQ13985.1 WD40 repeat domain-containing protein [Myxococcus landrumus]